MEAIVIDQFGDTSEFRRTELPKPELKPGHLLIEVAATSVNPVDLMIREMGPAFLAPGLPAVLHGDVAGTVVETAPDVVDFEPGDEVYACAGGVLGQGGALSEFMLADAALVAHKPKSLSMREAAALPLVSITAWEALRQRVAVKSGDKVLVHGATGGVGHIAIQLAKAVGAEVYATASTEAKLAHGRELGADHLINYRESSVREYVERHTGGNGFDVVFDTAGSENLINSFEAAKLNGNVITTVALGSTDLTTAHLRGLSLHVVFMLIPMLHNHRRHEHGAILREIASLVDAGHIRPLLDPHLFSMAEVGAAHRLMESGEHVGKISLEWD